MSADRWAICPRCLAGANAAKQKAVKKTEQSYGKVSPEEYLKLRARSESPVEVEPSLREDFYIGVTSDGLFLIDYSGKCSCGFEHKYKQEDQLEVNI